MANGFVLGRKNNSTRGGWEAATVTLSSGTSEMYNQYFNNNTRKYLNRKNVYMIGLSYPLNFPSRTINSYQELLTAVGNELSNIQYAMDNQDISAVIGFMGYSQAKDGGYAVVEGSTGGPFPGGTLYIFAKFVD